MPDRFNKLTDIDVFGRVVWVLEDDICQHGMSIIGKQVSVSSVVIAEGGEHLGKVSDRLHGGVHGFLERWRICVQGRVAEYHALAPGMAGALGGVGVRGEPLIQ